MRRLTFPLIAFIIAAAFLWRPASEPAPGPSSAPAPASASASAPASASALAPDTGNPTAEASARRALPPGVADVIDRIRQGGPFPYRQDGTVFGNREGRLPQAARGYYHEYTVPTSGASDRGARRLVTGGTPPVTWYYTDDHYRSFRRLEPGEVESR